MNQTLFRPQEKCLILANTGKFHPVLLDAELQNYTYSFLTFTDRFFLLRNAACFSSVSLFHVPVVKYQEEEFYFLELEHAHVLVILRKAHRSSPFKGAKWISANCYLK